MVSVLNGHSTFFPKLNFGLCGTHIKFQHCKMSEFETSHCLHFLFYYKTKCKFQLEIEKVAKNKSSLLKMGCFEVKRLTLLATFTLKQPVLGREFLIFGHFL